MPPGADVGVEGPHSRIFWRAISNVVVSSSYAFGDTATRRAAFFINAHRGCVSHRGVDKQRAGVSCTIFVNGLTSKLDALASD